MLDADWLLDEALTKLEDFFGMLLYSLQMYPIQSFVTVAVKILFPLRLSDSRALRPTLTYSAAVKLGKPSRTVKKTITFLCFELGIFHFKISNNTRHKFLFDF